MPLLGYKKQFADLVESGKKRQTIRATRKRPFKVGDRLYHYYGLRTKVCRKLLESDCLVAADIVIDEKKNISVNDNRLSESSSEALAHGDGFSELEDFIDFFKTEHGLPFKGQLIIW